MRKSESFGMHEILVAARRRLAQAEWELGSELLELQSSGLYRERMFGSVTHYCEKFLELDGRQASELMSAVRSVSGLPLLSGALREGRLASGKVREMAGVVNADNEAQWLEFARSHCRTELQRQVSLTPRQWAAGRSNGQLTLGIEDGGAEAGLVGGADCEHGASAGGSAAGPARAGEFEGAPALAATECGQAAREGAAGVVGPVAGASGPVPTPAQATPCEWGGHEGEQGSPDGCPGARGRSGGAAADATEGPPRQALPPSVPRRRVRVTLNFKSEEYAEFERLEDCLRSKLRKRVRREEVVLEMGRRAVAGTSAGSRLRHQVMIHADSHLLQGWCETDRGLLPLPTEQLEQALAEGNITFVPEGVDEAGHSAETSQAVTRNTMRLLWARSGGRCEACGAGGLLQVHHKRPRSRGGGHGLENLELRCGGCHDVVHEKDYRERPGWRAARDRGRARATKRRTRDG